MTHRGTLASRRRADVREQRREQLIAATIEAIARRGFAETTLARVAEGAGLSGGIVNFHFRSKDDLLVHTLRWLAEEYRRHWRAHLEATGATPAERLQRLLMADLEPPVCTRKKIAVWYAFLGEARSRPTYQRICGARDEEHLGVARELCAALVAAGPYRGVDPGTAARGLTALTDGLWLDLLMQPGAMRREPARHACRLFLERMFPAHYPLDAPGARAGVAAGAP